MTQFNSPTAVKLYYSGITAMMENKYIEALDHFTKFLEMKDGSSQQSRAELYVEGLTAMSVIIGQMENCKDTDPIYQQIKSITKSS